MPKTEGPIDAPSTFYDFVSLLTSTMIKFNPHPTNDCRNDATSVKK